MSEAEDFFKTTKTVPMDMQTPPPDLGSQIVEVASVRFHKGISGAGIITEVIQPNGEVRGFRIQLGGKFPMYGERDTKILVAALEGLTRDDPRAAAIGQDEIRPYIDGTNKGTGRKIKIDTTNDKKIDPKTGQPYRRVQPYALGSDAPPSSAGAAPPPAPVKAGPPAPPPAKAGPPAGHFEFPAHDPRHATHYYTAGGDVVAR